jgi:aspartate racemase
VGTGRPATAPAIVIDSLDVRRALRLVERDRPVLVDYMLASVRRLAAAGVDFAAMTANTPHIVFDEIAARSPVPLLSIVEVCAREAQRRGLRRPALLGTRFTMEAPFSVIADIPALDTTALHVAAIVERLRNAATQPSDAGAAAP